MAVQRDHPYGQFNFRLEIDGLEVAAFSEVSGLSATVDVIEYRNGNDRVPTPTKLTGLTRYPDVTLRRGMAGSLELWEWFEVSMRRRADANRSVVILLLDEEHEPVMRWELLQARPVRHTSGPLVALGDDVAIEELVLAHEGLQLV